MSLDDSAKWWAVRCLIVAIMLTLLHTLVPPAYDRAARTTFGLITAGSIIFCGLFPWVKKLPQRIKKRVQKTFDNGHPWVGLLGAWSVLLHTKFKFPPFWTTSKILYVAYFTVIISGCVWFYFHNMQAIMKDCQGSPKKEMAGMLLRIGKNVSEWVHFCLHGIIYVFLAIHVHMYWKWGFGFF